MKEQENNYILPNKDNIYVYDIVKATKDYMNDDTLEKEKQHKYKRQKKIDKTFGRIFKVAYNVLAITFLANSLTSPALFKNDKQVTETTNYEISSSPYMTDEYTETEYYMGKANDFNGNVSITTSDGLVTLNLMKEDGNIVNEGTLLLGSDGKYYELEYLSVSSSAEERKSINVSFVLISLSMALCMSKLGAIMNYAYTYEKEDENISTRKL